MSVFGEPSLPAGVLVLSPARTRGRRHDTPLVPRERTSPPSAPRPARHRSTAPSPHHEDRPDSLRNGLARCARFTSSLHPPHTRRRSCACAPPPVAPDGGSLPGQAAQVLRGSGQRLHELFRLYPQRPEVRADRPSRLHAHLAVQLERRTNGPEAQWRKPAVQGDAPQPVELVGAPEALDAQLRTPRLQGPVDTSSVFFSPLSKTIMPLSCSPLMNAPTSSRTLTRPLAPLTTSSE